MIAVAISLALALLLLTGWGLASWRQFFADAARLSMFGLMLAGILTLAWARLGLQPLRRSEAGHPAETVALAAMALTSAALVWLLPHNDVRGRLVFGAGEWLRWTGVALLSLGGGIRIRALHDLGDQFSAFVTLQPEHRLVRGGIYRFVRHPLYVSLLLAAPGFALVFRSRLVLPIFAVTLVFIANRIRREEHLLISRFGDAYREYRTRTWALVPFMI